MAFPKKRRNWKKVRATSVKDAVRQCKGHADYRFNLSVDLIADEFAKYGHEEVSKDTIYKWFQTGKIPGTLIQLYERICGINLITDYLVSGNNRLVIRIPTGKTVSEENISELQLSAGNAINTLIKYYRDEVPQDKALADLTACLTEMAGHRENVRKAEQPELDFGEE